MSKEWKKKNLWFEKKKTSHQFILYAAHFAVLRAEYWETFTVQLHVLASGYKIFKNMEATSKLFASEEWIESRNNPKTPKY
jgi:hypothetical protein